MRKFKLSMIVMLAGLGFSGMSCDDAEKGCNNGDLDCKNNVLIECKDGTWVNKQICTSSQTCDIEEKACLNTCSSSDAAVCDGSDKLKSCVDGLWKSVACESATPLCVDNVCVAKNCDENAVKCSDDKTKIEICLGNKWTDKEVCSNAVCTIEGSNAVCQSENPCTGDYPRCSGNTLLSCIANKESSQACENLTPNCEGADGEAACKGITPVCSEGTFRCSDKKLEKCSSNTWVLVKECAENSACNATAQDCQDASSCGDGTIDATKGELCEGSNFGDKTCASETKDAYAAGSLLCENSCTTINTKNCLYCGNNEIETAGDFGSDYSVNEVCDGTSLGGKKCADLVPNSEGTLKCKADCLDYDTSDCKPVSCTDGELLCNIPNGYSLCVDGAWLTDTCSAPKAACVDGEGCVECKENKDCPVEKPFCDKTDYTCKAETVFTFDTCDIGMSYKSSTCTQDSLTLNFVQGIKPVSSDLSGSVLITGLALKLGKSGSLELVVPKGVKDLSVNVRKVNSGTADVVVLVNDTEIIKELSMAQNTEKTLTKTAVNVSGSATIKITTTSQIVVDNLRWSNYP